MNNQNGNNWSVAREFTDKEAGLTIVVKRQTLPKRFPHEIPRPIFSYEVCRPTDSGHPVRYFGVLTETQNGKVYLRKALDTSALRRLIEDAEQWILDECQAHADAVIEAKQSREIRDMNRDKPKQQPGLKSLSKLDKAVKGYIAPKVRA